jgi:hypothetical protein
MPQQPDGPPAKSGRPYLNTRQTAHYLAVSVRTLLTMRGAGKGPRFRRHGRLVYYHVDDIEAWSRASGRGARS